MAGTKSSQTSEQLRNRLNQRMSRARRKDYVSQLEARIRAYETEGVRVTEAVQAAARHVADENRLLRQLLSESGFPTPTVEQYLRSRDLRGGVTAETVAHATKFTSGKSVPASDKKTNTIHARANALLSKAQSARPSSAQGAELDEGIQWTSSPKFSGSAAANEGAVERYAERSELSCSNSTTPSSSEFKDEIPCEEAAHIIANMRGVSEVHYVWPELGCSEGRGCRVKNSVVFALAQ